MRSRSPHSTLFRVGLPAALTLGAVVFLLASEPYSAPPTPVPAGESEPGKLSIEWVKPIEPRPKQAIIAEVSGLTADEPVRARFSDDGHKKDAQVLRRDGSRVVVQVPPDLPRGQVKLRIHQRDLRSKPRLLQIVPIPVRDMARDALGGLALLVLGLWVMSRALRRFADQRLRARLTTLTCSTPRSVGLGSILGGVTQSTTSSAGVLVGMFQARLLPERAAAGLLLGVQLGTATAGALLPLFATREALWVVALGALWTAAADDRRARSLGQIVMGAGVLLVGLSLMQAGVRPLLSLPELLPYVHDLGQRSVMGALVGAGLGAALAGLLQGPGPAFAVVLSLTQASGALSLSDGLVMLAGTAVGATLATTVVGGSSGGMGRRLAASHLVLGALVSTVALLGVPAWRWAAETLLGGSPNATDYSAFAMRPAMATHLSVGFLLSQLAGAVLCIPFLPAIGRLSARLVPKTAAGGTPRQDTPLPVLTACRTAIVELGHVLESRDREPAAAAERAITDARSAVISLLGSMEQQPTKSADIATATTCLHLATSIDGALRVAERALERDLRFDDVGMRHLGRVHSLLVEGIDALVAHVQDRKPLRLEELQAREIRLNALEAEARAPRPDEALAEQLWVSELSAACEAVGNHLYRLGHAIVGA